MFSAAINRTEKWVLYFPWIPLLYLCYAYYILQDYMQLSGWHFTAIIAYLFISRTASGKKINVGMLLASGIFLYLYYRYQTTTFLFISAVLFLIESVNAYIGRLNMNAHLLLIICSPVFKYAVTVFGFPLRLQLSSLAARILSFFVDDIETSGNLILLNGHEFAVDEACAGLNMLTTSFVFTILLIEIARRKSRREIPYWSVCAIYAGMLALNLLSNLLRICTLTVLKVYPADPMHEFIGIGCFCIYNLFPVHFLVHTVFSNWGRERPAEPGNTGISPKWSKSGLILVALTGVFVITQSKIQPASKKSAGIELNGLQEFQRQEMSSNIVKYYSEQALIYVKPLDYFYSTEHNPLFCWKGSGYEMQQFDLKKIGNHEVYSGKLLKNEQVMYSAWYYTDGRQCTASQWEWRIASVRNNKTFFLVNVSAASEARLNSILKGLF
jgi:exosortase N